MPFKFEKLAVWLLLLVGWPYSIAAAQDSPDAVTLDQITVTATRRPQALREVPRCTGSRPTNCAVRTIKGEGR